MSLVEVVKFLKIESSMVVASGWRKEGELFNGSRVSVLQMKGVICMDGGNGCATT